MFGASSVEQDKNHKKQAAKLDRSVTILTSGCHFKGKLFCRGSSRIGGIVEGTIVSEGLLIIEESAMIKGDVRADNVIVQGRVHGTIESKGRVELSPLARVHGDISTHQLIIQEGAQFSGYSKMEVPPVDKEQLEVLNSPFIDAEELSMVRERNVEALVHPLVT
jgi:cytoskeletal protein CcmA (bactofilin family)